MKVYADIKGAVELVEKHKVDFDTINESIEELKQRKEELNKTLDNSKDKFKLESIEKNAKTKHELNLINQYLKEAYQRKEELSKEANRTLVQEATTIAEQHVAEVKDKHKEINKEIAECLYKARNLQKEMDALEHQENKKINSFIDEIAPYFSDEVEFRKTTGGRNQRQVITHNIKNIFRPFPEPVYNVKGLTKPFLGAKDEFIGQYSKASEKQFNDLFGVNK